MATLIHGTGRRSNARRFVRALLVAAILFTSAQARVTDSPDVSVREEKGVYTVGATFVLPAPPAVVLHVLTDYERIPRFMPEVTSSIVRERADNRVVVEQEVVARMMMFSKRIHLLLDVRTGGDTIEFRDTSGRSFTAYEGVWRLAAQGGGTSVRYDLSAAPSFDVPGFLLKRLLKRDAAQMIARLRMEVAGRTR